MSERVLISPSRLSDLMKVERAVPIDKRDAPAYAEATNAAGRVIKL